MKEKSSNGKGKISNNRYWGQPFQERLRDLLYRTSAPMETMAEAMGVKRQTLSKYRDGENVPDIVTLGRIADYFGVSSDYLLGRTDVKTPSTDIKSVCEYTGLSEKSVYIMHEQQQEGYGTNAAAGINLLAKYNELGILELMQSYIRNCIKIVNGENFAESVSAFDKSTLPNLEYNIGSEEIRQIFKLLINKRLDILSDKYNADKKKESENNGNNNSTKE